MDDIGIGTGQVMEYLCEFTNGDRLAGADVVRLADLISVHYSEIRQDDVIDKDNIPGLATVAVDGDVVAWGLAR